MTLHLIISSIGCFFLQLLLIKYCKSNTVHFFGLPAPLSMPTCPPPSLTTFTSAGWPPCIAFDLQSHCTPVGDARYYVLHASSPTGISWTGSYPCFRPSAASVLTSSAPLVLFMVSPLAWGLQLHAIFSPLFQGALAEASERSTVRYTSAPAVSSYRPHSGMVQKCRKKVGTFIAEK